MDQTEDIPEQPVQQSPLSETQADQTVDQTSLKSSKLNVKWPLISLLVLFLGLAFGYLIFGRKSLENPQELFPVTKPGAIENKSTPPSALKGLNQIRIMGVRFAYPLEWIPIFGNQIDGRYVVYFAKTTQEAQNLMGCASETNCTDYSLKLEDLRNHSVWPNYTIESFIKETQKDINLDQLTEASLAGMQAWVGYSDGTNLIHVAVISSGTSENKKYTFIKATAQDNQTMEQYVGALQNIALSEYKSTKAKDLSSKKAFSLNIKSSLITDNYSEIEMVLTSLLAPKDDSKDYTYILYNETQALPRGEVGGPNYPKDNFLNSTYLLLTDNDQIQVGDYSTPQIQISLTKPGVINLEKYLTDSKYCEEDNDCQYRTNFCSIDAYNAYHTFFTPWGCGLPDYGDLGNYTDIQTKLNCQKDIEVKYDSIKCMENICKTINPEPACISTPSLQVP